MILIGTFTHKNHATSLLQFHRFFMNDKKYDKIRILIKMSARKTFLLFLGLVLSLHQGFGSSVSKNDTIEAVLVIGGYGGTTGEILDSTEMVRRGGKTCMTRLPKIPEPRYGQVAAILEDQLILCSGMDFSGSSNKCWTLDLAVALHFPLKECQFHDKLLLEYGIRMAKRSGAGF